MDKADSIIAALGGADNIRGIEACATRLRTTVADPTMVDEVALKEAGAFGVLAAGATIQVIVGADADALAADIRGLAIRERPDAMLAALGGPDNVASIEPCANRLRAVVVDPELVDQAALMDAGAFGVLAAGTSVQVIVGPDADTLAAQILGHLG